MNRRRVAEDNSEELFRFAHSYLSTAFPNPTRNGCPADTALSALASDPLAADPAIGEHISCCSPCFTRYIEILSAQRSTLPVRSRGWAPRPFAWVVAVLVLAAATTIYVGIRSTVTARRSTGGQAYARLVIDLEPFSSSRAPTEEEQPENPELILPRRPTDLVLELPVGSNEGSYRVSLNATDKVLWSALITASLNDHKLSLETNADFSKISAGHYLLRVESDTGIEINAPVFLGDRPAIQSESIRSRIYGILLDAALIGRNWLSDSYRHGVSEQSMDADKLLLDGDRYAWLGNWAAAGPLYIHAEALFRQRFDVRGEIHARVGRIRASAESMPFAQVSSMLGEELENSVVQSDARLKLFCLTAKGYTDLDVDPPSSRKDWEQARVLAKSLGERAQEGRAIRELGILSFLEGDGATAKKLVGSAFLTAVMMGDVGGQVRYLSMFGNGLNALQRYDEALEYFNRALSVAEHTPDIGFPFMAYEGKADALIALRNSGDAESLLNHALVEARRLGRRGHESQLYIVLGRMARARGDKEAAVKYLESAADLARSAQFYRMVADAMFELASLYRAENKLDLAEASLQQGIVASRKISDRFYLPRDLSALAEIKELQGDPEAAQALYEQATDVLDGLLVKSASPSAKRSIVAAMSDIYVRQFALAVRMGNRSKAFAILERARGRSAAACCR